MCATTMRAEWEIQKAKLKQKFAKLTDNDLLFIEGHEDETMGKLEKTLGKSKEELKKILKSL